MMDERGVLLPVGRRGQPGLPAAGLGGTGLVADDLYLLAHDYRSGRALLPPRPLGTGLGGGLLCELMLARCIALRTDGAVVIGQHLSRAAVQGHPVLAQIAAEPVPLPARTWLLFLARTAVQDVAQRLENAGYLMLVRSWVPGRPGRLVPADPDRAYAPMLRVRSALDQTRDLTPHAAVLAGLAVACGLGYHLERYQVRAGRSAAQAVASLPPDVRELISQTQITVAGAVLSHRT